MMGTISPWMKYYSCTCILKRRREGGKSNIVKLEFFAFKFTSSNPIESRSSYLKCEIWIYKAEKDLNPADNPINSIITGFC